MGSGKELSIPLEYIQKGLILVISGKETSSFNYQADADEYGESEWQLTEGEEYEFEFSNKVFTFETFSSIIRHSYKRSWQGLLRPGNYTGTLCLTIVNGSKNWPLYLEIRSKKVSYRSDYRFMLESITEYCTDLLMRHSSPVTHNFETNFTADSSTLYQRFSFVKSVIRSDEFSEAIHRIVLFPISRWKIDQEERSITSIRRFGKQEIRQLSKGGRRAPANGTLAIETIPNCIFSENQIETVDTHENRFVKYALEQFLFFCEDIERRIPNTRTAKEAKEVVTFLEDQLRHDLFRAVSKPTNLKLNSPVLQHKEGYREVLRAWLMFDLAAKLIWKGGNDVYAAGKRDIAILYEYWVFFILLNCVQRVFKIAEISLSDLIGITDDGLGLKLKKRKHLAITGVSVTKLRQLNVRFSFNLSFSNSPYPESGSWSFSFFPDYTLSVWPIGMTSEEAEEQEMIVHLHFDAKYKLNPLIFKHQKSDKVKSQFKKEDLLKMHAYRDAIRRTAGAYIIYPGDDVPYETMGFKEILPGLGAFAIRPSSSDSGVGQLEHFLVDIREHLMNRVSQREQLSAYLQAVYTKEPTDINTYIPEFDHLQKRLIPDNTTVLVGYYKSKAHIHWYEQKGLYNFRTGSGKSALPLTPEVVGAKYLLLYSKQLLTTELWEIIGPPQFWSKHDLIDREYPGDPTQDSYLVLSIRKPEMNWSEGFYWDVMQFDIAQDHIHQRYPFQVTLMELMKKAISNK